jgi:hypothetical protein
VGTSGDHVSSARYDPQLMEIELLTQAHERAARLLDDLLEQRKSLDQPNRATNPEAQESGRCALDQVILATRRTLDCISDASSRASS